MYYIRSSAQKTLIYTLKKYLKLVSLDYYHLVLRNPRICSKTCFHG